MAQRWADEQEPELDKDRIKNSYFCPCKLWRHGTEDPQGTEGEHEAILIASSCSCWLVDIGESLRLLQCNETSNQGSTPEFPSLRVTKIERVKLSKPPMMIFENYLKK
jgi:hypothetical protein